MQDIISLLQEWTHGIAIRNAVARANLEATCADADDIAHAVEKRESNHREWSCFTGREGRA